MGRCHVARTDGFSPAGQKPPKPRIARLATDSRMFICIGLLIWITRLSLPMANDDHTWLFGRHPKRFIQDSSLLEWGALGAPPTHIRLSPCKARSPHRETRLSSNRGCGRRGRSRGCSRPEGNTTTLSTSQTFFRSTWNQSPRGRAPAPTHGRLRDTCRGERARRLSNTHDSCSRSGPRNR